MAPNPLGREDARKGNTMGQAERSEARQSCIIYSRVSSDEQAKGYSLPTQEESCRRYCAEHGYTIVGVFHDAHSGTELDRPGLNAAIEAVDALKPTVVLLHDVDRLGREIIVQAIAERELTRHGARIEYVLGGGNATPEQELLKMMKQGIAVYENRQRVERSRRGKDGRVRAGGVLVAARPAYGYRYVCGDHTGTLEPHPDEAPIVQQIFAWCVDERADAAMRSPSGCATTGVPSRADTDPGVVRKRAPHHTWDPHTVARMLRNETYKGVWHWGKTRRVKRGDRDRAGAAPARGMAVAAGAGAGRRGDMGARAGPTRPQQSQRRRTPSASTCCAG